jgi:poly(hydroxyalkanoate) granule-associated protein
VRFAWEQTKRAIVLTFMEYVMVKKNQETQAADTTGAPLKDSVKDSAQLIWQAGLGALNRAQLEGAKAWKALAQEGASLQRKTQAVAEEKIAQTSSKMSTMATEMSSRAAGQWDKLENIFEDRVAKAMKKLGVPSAEDIHTLSERIDKLNQSVKKLSARKPVAKAAPRKTAKPAVRPAAHRERS